MNFFESMWLWVGAHALDLVSYLSIAFASGHILLQQRQDHVLEKLRLNTKIDSLERSVAVLKLAVESKTVDAQMREMVVKLHEHNLRRCVCGAGAYCNDARATN